ncbi:MAG: hypothetical protein KA945_13085, partial [Zoogloea sp.]|nr:hypothetical protein [Zoogloea sp.]
GFHVGLFGDEAASRLDLDAVPFGLGGHFLWRIRLGTLIEAESSPRCNRSAALALTVSGR